MGEGGVGEIVEAEGEEGGDGKWSRSVESSIDSRSASEMRRGSSREKATLFLVFSGAGARPNPESVSGADAALL